jgi:hypothetical protein
MTRGVAGKGSRSNGCGSVEYGQSITKDRASAVAVRAALESAVQLGRGTASQRPNLGHLGVLRAHNRVILQLGRTHRGNTTIR